MRTRFGVWGQCGRWIAALVVAGPLAAQEYEIGGPLQGVPLPPFPTQHGEPPGWPGVIPELQVADERGRIPFTTEGLPPERHLYDGSVEHFRAYWFKYVPVKSFFDRQSLLTNWLAAALAPGRAEDYAEPVWWVPRHADPRFTGRFNKPVPVVRAQAGDPAFALDCGTLAPGVYALRAIGAVESTKLQRHRTPLVLRLTINDGPAGESSVYRFRCKYVEEFYALAEFYFHAPEHRHYRATLAVDDESRTDVLLHTIDLHNALAGSLDRAIKTRCTLTTPLTNAVPVAANDAARLTADAELWNAFPPDNATVGFIYGGGGDDPKGNQPNAGAGGKTADAIKTQFGEWTTAPIGPVLATNKTLNLAYTMADLKALNPLPDPYPVKDRGTGVFTPAADTNTAPQNLWPIADRCGTGSGAMSRPPRKRPSGSARNPIPSRAARPRSCCAASPGPRRRSTTAMRSAPSCCRPRPMGATWATAAATRAGRRSASASCPPTTSCSPSWSPTKRWPNPWDGSCPGSKPPGT